MIRVLVSGSGKMGRIIVDTLAATNDCEPVGVVDGLATADSFATEDGAELPLFSDAAKACDATSPDVVIDFTNAAWTPTLTAAAVPRGVRPVIGTSALTQAYIDDLSAACAAQKLGGVVAANFAIGAVLMMHMAKVAARFFDAAEIIELHHDQKVDAPSGTAIATAHGMIAGREGKPFERNVPSSQPIPGARAAEVDGVTIHSVRLPGLVAHQEVLFGGLGQTLSIRHDTTGRDSFMPGVLLAVREVMHRSALVVGIEALVGLE
jgi:4-hydroxy-tetrahydrodipicolinate reductase